MLLAAALAGCGFARDIEIRQGSDLLTAEQLQSAKGLNTNEVRELLGAPQSRWQLDSEIWIYYFKIKNSDADQWLTGQLRFNAAGEVVDVQISQGGDNG